MELKTREIGNKMNDKQALKELKHRARFCPDAKDRLEAVEKINNSKALRSVAKFGFFDDASIAAVDKLASSKHFSKFDALVDVIHKGARDAAKEAARERVVDIILTVPGVADRIIRLGQPW